ncbi:ABC transporter ATP-binding protein [Paracoccus sanguinis]|uniref:ABC transporter ATP-binding protein n=1 Tax=Paracoccus sanguinis TaxID=1545044 RepID=UPI00145270A3|nr:ABC transporter ATP-binding protein [Paracoccus sanguinis]QJD16498.1 ABC transporter ATP-binding protein [Paracoccus sanguinis]
MTAPALQVRGLRTALRITGRWHDALRDIDLTIFPDETLAVVGESGCGKSLLAMTILGLLPPVARRAEGSIAIDGKRVEALSDAEWEAVRGARIGMIFQDPMSSLNPVLTVGEQIAEPIRDHLGLSARDAMVRALALMERVRIPSAAARLGAYPHQFSGGMRQRVMIAMAIACNPQVLIADEPTTALDVTVQRQILDLLASVQAERGMGIMLITHNLGIVASTARRVVVLYGGDLVECAPVAELFAAPLHPYTQALLASLPRVDFDSGPLEAIAGRVPPLTELAEGCRFANRCPHRMPVCDRKPPLVASGGHAVRCWLHVEGGE